jgi:GMP synthase (glutamine-hydrolysing)
MSGQPVNIYFIEMMGEPGSYDASVYDDFEDKDREGVWFQKRFADIPGVTIHTCNVCRDEELPELSDVDGVVLAGSYNSVHDDREWQVKMRSWMPTLRQNKTPILAICGSHQLLSHVAGSRVDYLAEGAYAGTFPIELTSEGRACPIMKSIPDNSLFQFANAEHVLNVPKSAVLLASSGRVPVAALDFGDHCYSTQFHPEGTFETLGAVWRNKSLELMENYVPEETGYQLVRNFLELVVELQRDQQSVSIDDGEAE